MTSFATLPRRLPSQQRCSSGDGDGDLFDFLQAAQLEQFYSALTRQLRVALVPQLKRVTDQQLLELGLTQQEAQRLRKHFHRACPQSTLARLRRHLATRFSAVAASQQRRNQHQQQCQQLYQYNCQSLHQQQYQQQQQHQQQRPASSFGLTSIGQKPLSPAVAADVTTVGLLIPRGQLQLGCRLGSGMFSSVHQATWRRPLETTVTTDAGDGAAATSVAVKILPEHLVIHADQLPGLIKLDHPSVARLLGLARDEDASWMLVTELAPLRSLLECLRDDSLRRSSFHVGALCEFSQQLAQAMSYLENRRLLHRSLAARNVLVFAKDRVKVADCGLAEFLACRDRRTDAAWSAPEVLQQRRRHGQPHQSAAEENGSYTSASDVWSFAVTLWEMFTYGQRPWSGLQPDEVALAIAAGSRLARPDACPAGHYALMLTCWDPVPSQRVTFRHIASHLPKIIPNKLVALADSGGGGGGGHSDSLDFRIGDVIIVLDEADAAGAVATIDGLDGGSVRRRPRGIRAGGAGGGGGGSGLFDLELTRPLLPGVRGASTGAASAPGASSTSARVTRRATLGASYAKEFGQRVGQVKRAAQERLLPAANVPGGESRGNGNCSGRRRLTSDMISTPRGDFRHAGHVGSDGSVFGDVSCLAELELTPTCEPPSSLSSSPSLPPPADVSNAGSADVDDSVRFRRPAPAAVDSLRCQSGYCRLGSSLSVGVETVAAASSTASVVDEAADCWDADDASAEDEWRAWADGDNGTSLIDEILQTWSCSVTAGATPLTGERDSDTLAIDTTLLQPRRSESANATASSSGATKAAAVCCGGNAAELDDGAGVEDSTTEGATTATPSTSVSSLNGGGGGGGEDSKDSNGSQQQQQQQPSQDHLHSVTVSPLVSVPIGASSCSSSLSSVGGSSSSEAAAGAAPVCSQCSVRSSSSPDAAKPLVASVSAAKVARSADASRQSEISHSDEEDIVDM